MAFNLKKSITSAAVLLLLGIPRLLQAREDSNALGELENQELIPGSQGLIESITETDFSDSHKFIEPFSELLEQEDIIQKGEDITRERYSEFQPEKEIGFSGSDSESQTDEKLNEGGNKEGDKHKNRFKILERSNNFISLVEWILFFVVLNAIMLYLVVLCEAAQEIGSLRLVPLSALAIWCFMTGCSDMPPSLKTACTLFSGSTVVIFALRVYRHESGRVNWFWLRRTAPSGTQGSA